jgi:hypothetical protein
MRQTSLNFKLISSSFLDVSGLVFIRDQNSRAYQVHRQNAVVANALK